MSASPLVRRVHLATLALHGFLTLGLFALAAASGSTARLVMALIAVVPLLLALPGLLRGSAYTAGWASMLVSFYCAMLMAEAYMTPSAKAPLIALSVIAALDFVALMLYAKAKKTADAGLDQSLP